MSVTTPDSRERHSVPELIENRRSDHALGGMAALFLISLFMPFSFSIGGIRLEPYRVILLFTLVPSLTAWASGRTGPKLSADYWVLTHVAWASLAILVTHGFVMLEGVGIYAIEVIAAYFLARTQVTSPKAFRTVFYILWFALLFTLPIAIIESLTNRNIIIELFGSLVSPRVYQEKRMGIFRAQSLFDHSILFGMIAGSLVAPAIYTLAKKRKFFTALKWAWVPLASAFLSVSSSAYSLVAIQLFFRGWDAFYKRQNRWKVLAWLSVIAYVILDLFSNRTPYHVLIDYLSFSSGSAYNRILIWEFASDDLFRNPLFGIGFREWDRPSWMHSGSTDNFWLVVALRYGIPGFFFLLMAMLMSVRAAIQPRLRDDEISAQRRGFAIMLVSMSIAVINVHLWNQPFVLFIFYLGVGGWFMRHDVKPDPPKTR